MDTSNTINQQAIELLDQAAFTSSAVKEKERRSGSVKDEHLFPLTREEALKMRALLARAWNVADDREEAEFKDKYERLNEIVEWSLTKHRTWQWPLIAGVLLFAALLLWAGTSNKDSIQSAKEKIKIIEAWEPCDTVITWETCAIPATDQESFAAFKRSTENTNRFKAYHLGEAKRRYLQNQESIASYKQKAENETDKEKKEGYLNRAKHLEKTLTEYREQFDELAPLKFEDVQKKAIARSETSLSSDRFMRNFFIINLLLSLILIGLYIWTGNPYGYEIARARTRNKILGWIQKAGMWFVGITLGAGIAQRIFADDIVWKYSDGHLETESDVGGTAMNIIWKLGLLGVGLIAFIVLSGFLMFVETAFAIPVKVREMKER